MQLGFADHQSGKTTQTSTCTIGEWKISRDGKYNKAHSNTQKSSMFAGRFHGISRKGSVFILRWFKLSNFCIQVTCLHTGERHCVNTKTRIMIVKLNNVCLNNVATQKWDQLYTQKCNYWIVIITLSDRQSCCTLHSTANC